MATEDNDTIFEEHIETEGLQYEISKKNIAPGTTDYGTADDFFHHNWQELSLQKNIRSLDEAKIFLESDLKNKTMWESLGYIDLISSKKSEFITNSFDLSEDGNTFNNPISSFGLLKSLSKIEENIKKSVKNETKSYKDNKKYDYNDYLNEYTRTANYYSNIETVIGTYSSKDEIENVRKQYSIYGDITVIPTPESGGTKFKVTLPSETQAAIYNKTEAIRLAKLRVTKEQQKDKDAFTSAKNELAAEKQTEAARIAVFKDIANKNDKIRADMKKIEEEKALEEQKRKNLEAAEMEEREAAEENNKKTADRYESEMRKAGNPISSEEKESYLEDLNNKSFAKISSKYEKLKLQINERTGILEARAEAATIVSSTSGLFSELEVDAQKKKQNFLSKTKGLIGKAASLYGKISDFLNGKFDLSKFDVDILAKTGLLNNKFISSLFKQLGLKEGLFDNFVSDLYKVGSAYAKDMLDSVIKRGLSKLLDASDEAGAVDEMLLITVKPLVWSGGDPNYNGTFLHYILTADCPKSLAYLDEYNGISEYTLESPGKEYSRGVIAAKNGCHKVALYVAEKLYDEYTKNNNGTATAKPDVANKYADEIAKIFKYVVVYSYNNFNIDQLKTWFSKFPELLKPCMFGEGDTLYNGKYKITNSDINTIAKIVEVSEFSTDNMENTFSFSSQTGMNINGMEIGGKFGKNNISTTKKYIDIRNKNIKLLYVYLVDGDDHYSKSEKLTHKDLHERLSNPTLISLSKANNNLINNLSKTDTFSDLSYLMNGVIRASVHRTLTLMASNNLIPLASYNSGNVNIVSDTSESIPEFVDYSTSTIHFINIDGGDDNSELTQTVTNGKSTKLNANTFTKKGYRFLGWSNNIDDSNIVYENNANIVTNTDIRLYAVWEVDPNYIPESTSQTETGIDNKVENDITDEEINEQITKILSSSVQLPEIFKQYELTFDNFKCVDTYDKSTIQIAKETSNENFKFILNKIINSYSDNEKSYSIQHDTNLYTNKLDVFNNIENENDKLLCYYYALCYTTVQQWARHLPYGVIETMFGDSKVVETYKIDEDENFIYDIYGNKIIDNVEFINTPDQKFAECLSIFKDACNKIREFCLSIYSKNECVVEFDLCGLTDERIPSFKVNAYDSIEAYEPIAPKVEGFVFKGWSTDPNGNKIIDWKNDVIFKKNNIFFAIWKKVDCYIKDFTIRKNKNETLLGDIVGTIDHENEIIKLYIRSSEIDENNRYYVHIDLPQGCVCDINTKQKITISETSNTQITVTDDFGNEKNYFTELHVLADDWARISYVTDNAKIINTDDYSFANYVNTEMESLPTAEKEGFIFKGWSLDNKTIVESITTGDLSTVLYAVFEEIEYNITYMNSGEEKFDGIHTYPYNTTIKYNEGKLLDIPTKDKCVFDGYYKDKDCVTERINALYKYNYTSDATLYASWIDSNEYVALNGPITINGIEITLSDLIFYTKMIMSNGEQWVVSGTGLNVYGLNGNKLRSFIGLIGGRSYIPLGITTIGSENNSTVLAIVRHVSKNKVYLYYSANRGLTWESVMECTRLNFILSDSTGAETVNYLTFYQTIVYNGHLYSVCDINGDSSIIIDGNESLVLLSASNSQFNITRNRRILCICVTVDEKLYVLFEHVGVIMYTNFEPIFDKNGNCTLNPNMKGIGVSGWSDNYYHIDVYNVGNPYTAANYNINFDDDFDINDRIIINNIKTYYADRYLYIKTYLKIEDNEDPISDLVWLWSFNFANSGIILSEKSWVVENMDNFRPSILKDRHVIRLEVKPKHTKYTISEVDDLESVRKIQMTKDNCLDYLGWTRVIYDTNDEVSETVKITEDYLTEMDILTGNVREPWFIKYTRSELVLKEITTSTGEKYKAEVYNQPEESERSDIFLKYLKYGKL